jgi:hypothetical protein
MIIGAENDLDVSVALHCARARELLLPSPVLAAATVASMESSRDKEVRAPVRSHSHPGVRRPTDVHGPCLSLKAFLVDKQIQTQIERGTAATTASRGEGVAEMRAKIVDTRVELDVYRVTWEMEGGGRVRRRGGGRGGMHGDRRGCSRGFSRGGVCMCGCRGVFDG